MFNAGVTRALNAAADLINTAEGPKSARHTPDSLETVESLTTFLKGQPGQLQWPTSTATGTQLEKVRQLRSTLRTVWAAGPITESADLEPINELLEGVGTELRFSADPDEPAVYEAPIPVSTQVHHVMTATIAAAVSHLVVSGETGRLRICQGDDCQAAIVDLTRNRSKLFCDFGNCANRAHVRAYRARQAQQRTNDDASTTESARLNKPSAAAKAEQLNRPTSVTAVAAKEFRNRMRDELMHKRRENSPKK